MNILYYKIEIKKRSIKITGEEKVIKEIIAFSKFIWSFRIKFKAYSQMTLDQKEKFWNSPFWVWKIE